jgi:hypothetical protein
VSKPATSEPTISDHNSEQANNQRLSVMRIDD